MGCVIKTSHINKLVKLQNRAIRTITRSKYNSQTEPLLKKLNILKINDLYKQNTNKFMYRYRHDQLLISFINTFSYNYEIHPQRQPVDHTKYTFLKTNSLTHFQNISFQTFGTSILLMSKTKTILFVKQVKSDIVKSYSSYVNCANPYCHHCTDWFLICPVVTDLILINLFYDMVEAPRMIFFLAAYIHFTCVYTHRTLNSTIL